MVSNGDIPDSQLVTGIQGWAKLWPSTAAKFAAMNADLVAHGYPLMIITTLDWAGAYRDIPLQKLMKVKYGAGAATPTRSNHGLGRAWDINNISHYPAGVIPAYAKKHGLLIDAGNGHGGIESWHMHDADGITPAGGDEQLITPDTPDPVIPEEEEDDMNRPIQFWRLTKGDLSNSTYLAVYDSGTGLVGVEFDARTPAGEAQANALALQHQTTVAGKAQPFIAVPIFDTLYNSIRSKLTLLTPPITSPLA